MSELSFQEGSVYNSEMECTNFEQQSQTEPLDIKLVQPDQNSMHKEPLAIKIMQLDQQSDTHYSLQNMGGQVQVIILYKIFVFIEFSQM